MFFLWEERRWRRATEDTIVVEFANKRQRSSSTKGLNASQPNHRVLKGSDTFSEALCTLRYKFPTFWSVLTVFLSSSSKTTWRWWRGRLFLIFKTDVITSFNFYAKKVLCNKKEKNAASLQDVSSPDSFRFGVKIQGVFTTHLFWKTTCHTFGSTKTQLKRKEAVLKHLELEWLSLFMNRSLKVARATSVPGQAW